MDKRPDAVRLDLRDMPKSGEVFFVKVYVIGVNDLHVC